MKFKAKLLLSLAAAMFAACGPSKYTMHLEMRYPSKAGVDLAGKQVSVIYLENGNHLQDQFNSYMADGFAASVEKEYGTGEGSIGIYKMSRIEGADYTSKDTLVNLLVDTGADVVFIMDTVKFGEVTVGRTDKVAYSASPDSSYITTASVPYTIKMSSLDAMDKEEKVRNYGGTAVVQPSVYSDGHLDKVALNQKVLNSLPAEGYAAGTAIAESFRSQWKIEGYSIAYFDSSKWIEALEKADQFDWKGAMDIWFGFLDSTDIMKRSCAAYNIALSCYMSGDYALAEEWLNLSDKESELPMAESLRKRINARK